MKVLKTLVIREDDGALIQADTIEYEGKRWIVTEWIPGPTAGTEQPARMICLDGMRVKKAGAQYSVDLVLENPLSKDFLEGRAIMLGVVVLERPDLIRRVDTDFLC